MGIFQTSRVDQKKKDHELNACVKHLIFATYSIKKTWFTRTLACLKNKLNFDVNKNAQKEREEKKKIQ